MKHKISVRFSRFRPDNFLTARHIRRCISASLELEKVSAPCEINVLVTDDDAVQAINKTLRQIDAPTDVLSFPMFQLTPGAPPQTWDEYLDRDTGLVPLGDMAISLERAKQQAAQFGHSVRREVGYLTIHSTLHLLGYDHLDEAQMKRQMRAREEAILAEIVLPR